MTFSIVCKSYTFRYRPLSNQECNRAVHILGNILFLLYFNHTDICPFLNLSLECTLTIFKVRNSTNRWRICGCVNSTLKRVTFVWGNSRMMGSVRPLNRIWQHVRTGLPHRCICCCYFCSAHLVLSLAGAAFTPPCLQNYRLGLPDWSRCRRMSSNIQIIGLTFFFLSLPSDFLQLFGYFISYVLVPFFPSFWHLQ